MRTAAALLAALAASLSVSIAEAQRCPTVGLFYIVRGDDGQVLSDSELAAVAANSPAPIGDGVRMAARAISMSADGTYQGSLEGQTRIPVIWFSGVPDDCTLRLAEATLVYHGRKMRLIFNYEHAYGPNGFSAMRLPAEIASRAKHPSIYLGFVLVDSQPFRAGTVELDLNRWLGGLEFGDRQGVLVLEKPGLPTIRSEFWSKAP